MIAVWNELSNPSGSCYLRRAGVLNEGSAGAASREQEPSSSGEGHHPSPQLDATSAERLTALKTCFSYSECLTASLTAQWLQRGWVSLLKITCPKLFAFLRSSLCAPSLQKLTVIFGVRGSYEPRTCFKQICRSRERSGARSFAKHSGLTSRLFIIAASTEVSRCRYRDRNRGTSSNRGPTLCYELLL